MHLLTSGPHAVSPAHTSCELLAAGRGPRGAWSKWRAANSPQACFSSCVALRGALSARRACVSSRTHACKMSHTHCTESFDASAHAHRSSRTDRCHSCACGQGVARVLAHGAQARAWSTNLQPQLEDLLCRGVRREPVGVQEAEHAHQSLALGVNHQPRWGRARRRLGKQRGQVCGARQNHQSVRKHFISGTGLQAHVTVPLALPQGCERLEKVSPECGCCAFRGRNKR